MFRARVIDITVQQLLLRKVVPCVSLCRNLRFWHQTVGGVRWMSSSRPAPLLTAMPVRALIDDQISIKARFLSPHMPVTVCAEMHCEDGDQWESFAHFNTKADGTVNLTRDHSVGGTYLGCEPMGLFWSLQPAPGAREGLRLRKKNVETPYVVHLCLLEGHVSPSKSQNTKLASVTTERWYMAPGVQRVEIQQNGVVGTLFLPPGPGPFPAMLDLWGMGGGLMEYRSALMASRGYASLSLAYFGHKDLPGPQSHVNVGEPYFKAAFQLLRDHPQVCADRVGIIGLSFGVYITLQLATRIGVKPSCVICINGPMVSSFNLSREDGLTGSVKGNKLVWTYDDQGHVVFVSAFESYPPETKVKIEDIECPFMYVEGEDDVNSLSKENADMIEQAMNAAGKSHLFTRLSYPGAGHLIEPPYAPNARKCLWRVKPDKLFVLWGGHPAPHAAAQEDSWKKILAFLESHLRS